jgi:hypothetical protein
MDGRAIVDGERDARKQEISLAGRPRGKRLIAPRTTVQSGSEIGFRPRCCRKSLSVCAKRILNKLARIKLSSTVTR